jgi:hypothetical protein
MPLPALVIPIATMAGEQILKALLGKAFSEGISMLFSSGPDKRIDEALRKLDTVLRRQDETLALIETLPGRVGLHGSVQKIYRQVRGLLLVIEKGKPTSRDYDKLR